MRPCEFRDEPLSTLILRINREILRINREILRINREIIHHGAEIALLRDLHRAKPTAT